MSTVLLRAPRDECIHPQLRSEPVTVRPKSNGMFLARSMWHVR